MQNEGFDICSDTKNEQCYNRWSKGGNEGVTQNVTAWKVLVGVVVHAS